MLSKGNYSKQAFLTYLNFFSNGLEPQGGEKNLELLELNSCDWDKKLKVNNLSELSVVKEFLNKNLPEKSYDKNGNMVEKEKAEYRFASNRERLRWVQEKIKLLQEN